MTEPTRRAVFAAAGLAAAAVPSLSPAAAPPRGDLDALARNEAYWARVAALYDRPAGVIQLENGNFGQMARPVALAYREKLERVNRETSVYARGPIGADLRAVRAKVARHLEVGEDEIVFTRGTTESMQVLIGGYNRLKPGDAVLYADLDYDAMQTAMEWLAKRRGVRVVKIALPEPATRQNLIDAYDRAFAANPDVRMALVTHLSHRTGLIPPVREIAEVARARNVDLLLDGGHALGQTEFRLRDLGCDFVGLNMHKWIGAPLGVGVIYIRKDRIGDIDASMSEADRDSRIDARVHTGTVNYAAVLATADAIEAHEAIGVAAKARRLRHLRDLWAEPLRSDPRFEVLTPADPALYAGLTAFRLKGRTSLEENRALRQALHQRHGIFTIERAGPAKGACVRVTPAFINTPDDMQRLLAALRTLPSA